MATTTNYSFPTPDDTALVKDGASAIRSLGSAVDTTVKNLNPETTLGDISYRSSTANVKTRLGLGSAGQLLAVNSGATAPEWITFSSGGITLLSTTNLSGSATTVSSISQDYRNLVIRIDGPSVVPGAGAAITMRANSISTSSYSQTRLDTTTATVTNSTSQTLFTFTNVSADADPNARWIEIEILDYANTATKKSISALSNNESTNTQFLFGNFNSTGAISSITIADASSNSMDGGTIKIYGVK
jgi:hypothetical protein